VSGGGSKAVGIGAAAQQYLAGKRRIAAFEIGRFAEA
jgi:hypothetical protein